MKKLLSVSLLLLFVGIAFAAELKVTLEHPFLVEGGWVAASELKVGDELTASDGRKARIKNIIDVDSPIEVYNLHVAGPNTFFANDILVHNKAMPANARFRPSHPRVLRMHNCRGEFVDDVVVSSISEKRGIRTVFKTKLGDGRLGAKATVNGRTGEIRFWKGGPSDKSVHHIGSTSRFLADDLGRNPCDTRWQDIIGMIDDGQLNPKELSRYVNFELQLNSDNTITAIRNGLPEQVRAYRNLPTNQDEFWYAIKAMQDEINAANRAINPTLPVEGLPIVDPNMQELPVFLTSP